MPSSGEFGVSFISEFFMASTKLYFPIIILLISSLLAYCFWDTLHEKVRIEYFSYNSPKPSNWNSVDISNVEIESYDDLSAYWSSKDRTGDQFFKAAYQSILDNILDDDMVFLSVGLMEGQNKNYEYDIELLDPTTKQIIHSWKQL